MKIRINIPVVRVALKFNFPIFETNIRVHDTMWWNCIVLQALFVYIGETLVKMKNYDDVDKWYQYITGDQPIRAKEIINLRSFANVIY